MTKTALYWLLVCCWFTSITSVAQSKNYRFDNWNVEHGLPQPTADAIAQDPLGFVWIATLDGLVRFDGKGFAYFDAGVGKLIDNYLSALAIDKQGWIWVGSHRGLTRVNSFSYEYQHFLADDNNPNSIPDNRFFDIHVDSKNRVWFATSTGISRFDQPTDSFYRYSVSGNSNSANPKFVSIGSDSKNHVYALAESGQVYRLDNDSFALTPYQGGNEATRLLVDSQDRLWLANADDRVTVFDLNSNWHKTIELLDKGHVRDMAEDQQGNMWFATIEGGLQRLSNQFELTKITGEHTAHAKNLLQGPYRSLMVDKDNILWVGSVEFGFFRQNLLAANIEQFVNHQRHSTSTFALAESSNGQIWIGENDRIDIVSKDDFSQLITSIETQGYTFSLQQLGDNLWLAGTGEGLVKIQQQDGRYRIQLVYQSDGVAVTNIFVDGKSLYLAANNGVYVVEDFEQWHQPLNKLQSANADFNPDAFYYDGLKDTHGQYWFVGREGSVVSVSSKDDQIKFYTTLKNHKGIATSISSIVQLNDNTLLFGTFNGIYRYDLVNKIAQAHGVLGESYQVCGLIKHTNSIWANTGNGIIELDKTTLKIKRVLNKNHGTTGGSCNIMANLRTEQQCVVFGMLKGVSKFCPDQLPPSNEQTTAKVLLTNLGINYRDKLPFKEYQQYSQSPLLSSQRLQFDDLVKQFSVDFTTIDFSGTELGYAYKMDNLMDEWVEAKGNKVSFTTLPSGKYKLHIKAYERHQAERFSIASIDIIKTPPWWLAPWAFVFYLVFVLTLFVSAYKLKTLRNKRLTRQLKTLVHEKTAQLVEKNNEILEQKQALELAASRLQQLMEQKNTMLSAISHEMKTPLTVINGALQHIEQYKDKKDLALELLNNNSQRLTAFVEQILLVSKYKKTQSADIQAVPLSAIVRTVTNYLEPVAKRYEQNLQVYIQQEIEICADAPGIELAFNNLVKNAIVHSGRGNCIEVKLSLNDGIAQLVVADNGQGMDGQTLASIFEPFSSGSKETGSVHSGLGMSLCQQIIDVHEGQISVESQLAKGTRITVELPNGRVMEDSQDYISTLPKFVISSKINNENDSNKPLILIADDEPDILLLLSMQLGQDFRLILANGGLQAIDLIKKRQPDMVILDRYMPMVSGIEVLHQIRLLEQSKNIPVIMFSADTSDENQIQGLRAGIDLFVKKPFDYHLLKVNIKRLLEKQSFANKETKLEQNLQDESLTEQPTNAQKSVAREKDFLIQLSEVVQQSYQDSSFSVKHLAAQFAMSEVTFRNKVQQMTGVLPKHYLNNYRCEKAKVRLDLQSDLTIADIAHSCGFKDEAQMRRWFKEFYGLTPSQMRKGG